MKAHITTVLLAAITLGCGVKSRSGGGYRPSLPSPGSHADAEEAADDATDPTEDNASGGDTASQPETDNRDTAKAFGLQAGVRNYAEVNVTMSALTGVSPATPNVKTAYDTDLTTALPAGNDAAAFLGSHQVAVTKLAVEYCDAAFESTTLRAQLIPGFNFALAPSAAFTPANKALVATSLTDRFWGTGLSDRPSSNDVQPKLVALIDDILVGKVMTDVNVTKNVIKGVCTAVLASAPVTMF